MGLVIVAGFVFVGVEVYRRINDPERRLAAGRAVADRPVQTDLGLPQGARIEDILAVGNRIVFRVRLPGGDRLYVMDPRTGAVTATVLTGPDGIAAGAAVAP